jgi:glycosyltransferase involved in cell wall biosynthesis
MIDFSKPISTWAPPARLAPPSKLDVIGVFPGTAVGGVQSSAREAWRAVVACTGRERARALFYEPDTSRARAVLSALRSRHSAPLTLIWHLHLLKLVPFLGFSRSRVILFLHGIEAWRRQDGLTRWLLRRVSLVLSNSDYTWARFVEYNPECAGMPHRTVHLGLGSATGDRARAPVDPPVAVMLGRLKKAEGYKGHRQMIEAWPHVQQSNPRAQLWIVGDGDLRSALEALARRLPGNSITFFGQVSEQSKERLLAHSRFLALPSRGEGFGLVYLEAMRLGRPCLVSDTDAGREVVGPPEAGLAVNPDDPRALSAAIERLLNPGDEWTRWSAGARARYESRFTAAHFHQRLLTNLFESDADLS